MDEIVGKIVIGASIAVGIGLAGVITRRRNQRLAPAIEPLLRERGPLTLPELATAMDMGSFYARGKVALALNDLIHAGRVEVIAAPAGTPQLQRVDHIRYRWREG